MYLSKLTELSLVSLKKKKKVLKKSKTFQNTETFRVLKNCLLTSWNFGEE